MNEQLKDSIEKAQNKVRRLRDELRDEAAELDRLLSLAAPFKPGDLVTVPSKRGAPVYLIDRALPQHGWGDRDRYRYRAYRRLKSGGFSNTLTILYEFDPLEPAQ